MKDRSYSCRRRHGVSNGQFIDSTGAPPVPDAAFLIEHGRITYAGPAAGTPKGRTGRAADRRPRRDDHAGAGRALPPDVLQRRGGKEDLDIKYPVEYMRRSWRPATHARSRMRLHGGARRQEPLNIDVWLKKAIENGVMPGPRLSASGREICGVGGLMDWNPDFRKIGMEGLVLLVNGPDEARAAVRKLVKDGVEWVKTYPTGDAAADLNDHHTLCMTFEEMHAVVATARNHGLKVTGHCRATEDQTRLRAQLRHAGARDVHR
ncbi:MAG: hypothetical protein U0992_11775 [Planctomycetaceae bacterium]